MIEKDIVKKILEVLDSIIAELSPQMGLTHTDKLFAITTEIEQMIEDEKGGAE